ncbi:MAG TPA: transposase domain-containing protein, partial [Candidatus Binatia bacterium]
FAGFDRGGERAADIYTLIITAKLNDVDPRAWLADVLARISDHPASRLDEFELSKRQHTVVNKCLTGNYSRPGVCR